MLSGNASACLQSFASFDLTDQPAVVAAVSGGSDSTAMLLLLDAFVRRSGSPVRLLVATVDHRLRPESADEARSVAALAQRLGHPHRTLPWEGRKPTAGLADAAREARQRLLSQAAAAFGATRIVVGHTADDQAETVAMRRSRGEGPGLAGIAPATLLDGRVWIVRPLLEHRREDLRACLRSAGVGWAEDPTNGDPAYERPRLRAALGGEIAPLLAVAAAASARREALSRRAGTLLRTLARMPAPGLYRLDAAILEEADNDAAVEALRLVAALAGGAAHRPPLDRAEAVFDRMRDGAARATLARALLARRGDGLWLARETRNLPGAGAALPGAIWDGRWQVTGRGEGRIGAGAADPPTAPDLTHAPAALLKAARMALPVVVPDGPSSHLAVEPVAAPWQRLLPSFDLEAARALAALCGAREPPPAPWGRHIGRPR